MLNIIKRSSSTTAGRRIDRKSRKMVPLAKENPKLRAGGCCKGCLVVILAIFCCKECCGDDDEDGYIPQTVEQPRAANVVLVPMAEETPAVGGGGSCAGDCCRSFCMTLGLNALLNCLC
ncbi:hypothetical protein LPJ62_003975 [Coemansia sp. RSA 2167]|nr:hypothetical protein LPJ62_003975 [Coemansia sp. RSA 2167]